MRINIISWNMQGWTSQRDTLGHLAKWDALCRKIYQIDPAGTDYWVILLQESGDPSTSGLIHHSLHANPYNNQGYICLQGAPDPTAKVLRCTTAFLVSQNLANDCKVSECKYEWFSGVDRPLLYVIINDSLLIATTHIIANRKEAYIPVTNDLKQIMSVPDIAHWLFMGDFNSHPDQYVSNPVPETYNRVNLGTQYRPLEYNLTFSRFPTQGTQIDQSGNVVRTETLDYLFSSVSLQGRFSALDAAPNTLLSNYTLFDSTGLYLSDHNLIGVQAEIPGILG